MPDPRGGRKRGHSPFPVRWPAGNGECPRFRGLKTTVVVSAVVAWAALAAAQPPALRNNVPVDRAAHDRGRDLWATQCVDCHGPQARGSAKGPNIISSAVVNFDRASPTPGSVLGAFLKKGHPTQSGAPSAAFTDAEIVALAHFLRQRVNDTMRGSSVFVPGDIVTGDAKAGAAFFDGPGEIG